MKIFGTVALIVLASATLGGCKLPKKYVCTIRDAKTGQVIKKVNVNSKAECDAIALGF
jgi:hypothetical protein